MSQTAINLLVKSEVFGSMNRLTLNELNLIQCAASWEPVLLKQRAHIDECLCTSKTQLMKRNQKLILLDLHLCQEFRIFSPPSELFDKRRLFLNACIRIMSQIY